MLESAMKFTGERFLPSIDGAIALEHLHRYLVASLYVHNKDVLDIASGEGYGSAMLASNAKTVIGVDISEDAIAHATARYAAKNLEFRAGNAAKIPIEDASVDVVVSFETIEHHDQHDEMFKEIKRVLRPGGVLCMSSPDKFTYSVLPKFKNEYHVKELTKDEFQNLLSKYFKNFAITGQKVSYGSIIGAGESQSSFYSWDGTSLKKPCEAGVAAPIYLIAIASDAALPELTSGVLEAPIVESDAYMKLVGQYNNLNEHNANVEHELVRVSAEYCKIREQNMQLEQLLHDKDFYLNSVLNSKSWKITYPLRCLMRILRKMKI